MSRDVVIGLGSNLGDRMGWLRAAVDALDASDHVEVIRLSRVYETAPIGPPQGDYLNAAVRVSTRLDLPSLHALTSHIEHALGRRWAPRWGPRTVDLDLLWSDGPPVASPTLTVPHPRLLERAFALAPLLDVLALPDPGLPDALSRLGGAPRRRRPFDRGGDRPQADGPRRDGPRVTGVAAPPGVESRRGPRHAAPSDCGIPASLVGWSGPAPGAGLRRRSDG